MSAKDKYDIRNWEDRLKKKSEYDQFLYLICKASDAMSAIREESERVLEEYGSFYNWNKHVLIGVLAEEKQKELEQ